MIILSEEEFIFLHSKLIQRYGGLDGIRDRGGLDSAINAPFQTFDGQELYPTVIEKTVRLAYGLITNHPFIDGNKRIGAMALLIVLKLNHYECTYRQEELIHIIMSVASGSRDEQDLLHWVTSHLDN